MPKNYSDIANKQFYKKDSVGLRTKEGRNEPVFNLKVPESEKTKEWYVAYCDYIVPPYSSVVNGYKEMKTNYEVLNNNLTGFRQQLDNFINPLGENIGQIEEELLPYPKLHNKVNVLKGEMLKRKDNHKVVLLTAKAIKEKDLLLVEELKASVEEELQMVIEKVQLELQGRTPQQIEQFIQETRTQLTPKDILSKNFLTEWEIFYSKGLKYCYFDQEIQTKKLETFEDVIAVDRFFIYSGWMHGKPYVEVRNPLYCGFHKAPNEPYVNKGDYFWYKKPITISDVYNNYGNLLTQDEIESLGIHTYGDNQRVDRRHSLDPRYNDYVFDHTTEHMFRDIVHGETGDTVHNKLIGTHQGQGINTRYNKENLVWETHIEFKAFRRVIFLSYNDEYNVPITIILSDKFDIPKDAKKIKFTNRYGDMSEKFVWMEEGVEYTAEILFIPRKYEVIRLGADIYPIFREVPFQETNVEAPYSSFNLSTFGGILTSRNAKSVSLLQRALPLYFQYIYIKHIQNRELAKYQGAIQSIDLDQIPDDLGKDIYGNEIRDKVLTYLYYLKRTNKDFYSGSQNSLGGMPPATRSPGSSGFMLGTAVELINLQQLLEYVDKEIGMAMGISPQRESNFTADSNVRDNQQAITQSHHITEPYFYLHNEIWKHALEDYLKNFRYWAKRFFENNPSASEHTLQYMLPDGTEELLKITPKMLDSVNVALFLSNSGQDQEYLRAMYELSHAFAQNSPEHGIETVSAMVKAITSGASPEEVHKMVVMNSKEQAQRQAERQQQMDEINKQMVQMEIDSREDTQQHEVDMQERKYFHEKELKAMDVFKFQEDLDTDGDGTPDPIEILKHGHEVEIKRREGDQKDRELDQRDKEINLKKEEMKSKERIEKAKAKQKPASNNK